jgi:hypothetical protein
MDVAAWLRGLGLERYAPAFRDNDVDDEVLPELTSGRCFGHYGCAASTNPAAQLSFVDRSAGHRQSALRNAPRIKSVDAEGMKAASFFAQSHHNVGRRHSAPVSA